MLIAGNKPDLIVLTEILPKSHCNSLSAAKLSLPRYQGYFNFDLHSHQALEYRCGVGIYVSNKLPASKVYLDSHILIAIYFLKMFGFQFTLEATTLSLLAVYTVVPHLILYSVPLCCVTYSNQSRAICIC